MAFQIIWSEAASEDLKEIVQFIAQDDNNAAVNLANRIISRIEIASDFPLSNRIVPEKGIEAIREAILNPYRIVYQIDSLHQTISIMRIWHASRGIQILNKS